MNINTQSFNSNHYATSVEQAGDMIKWTGKGATHYLILYSGTKRTIRISDEEVRELRNLSDEAFLSGEVQRLNSQYSFVVLEKTLLNQYRYPIKPACYGVFCLNINPEKKDGVLYLPKKSGEYQCTVSTELEFVFKLIEIKPNYWKKLMGVWPDTYYTISMPVIPGYQKGLVYQYDDYPFPFPITQKMLGKELRVGSFGNSTPKVVSTMEGYSVKNKYVS